MLLALWLDKLREWDINGFHLVNRSLQKRLFDSVFPFVTDKWNFALPLVLLILYVFLFRPKRDWILAISGVTVVLLADGTGHLLKNHLQRIRPCHVWHQVHLPKGTGCPNSFSLPSNHAANLFALATLLSYNYRWLVVPCFAAAALVGFSQIYSGVHYPTDILAGAVWGVLMGSVVALAVRRLTRRLGQVNERARMDANEDHRTSHTKSSQ